MSSSAPPPGWYPDGYTPSAGRWFDGTAWTEHVTPLATAGPVPAGQPSGAPAGQSYGAQAGAPYGLQPAPQAGSPYGVAPSYGSPYAPQYGAPAKPDLGPSNGLHWVLPVGRSWQSITAGYLGLFALLAWSGGAVGPVGAAVGVATGGAALWLGIVAVRRAASGGHGRGRAWCGIVAGAACVVLTLVTALQRG